MNPTRETACGVTSKDASRKHVTNETTIKKEEDCDTKIKQEEEEEEEEEELTPFEVRSAGPTHNEPTGTDTDTGDRTDNGNGKNIRIKVEDQEDQEEQSPSSDDRSVSKPFVSPDSKLVGAEDGTPATVKLETKESDGSVMDYLKNCYPEPVVKPSAYYQPPYYSCPPGLYPPPNYPMHPGMSPQSYFGWSPTVSSGAAAWQPGAGGGWSTTDDSMDLLAPSSAYKYAPPALDTGVPNSNHPHQQGPQNYGRVYLPCHSPIQGIEEEEEATPAAVTSSQGDSNRAPPAVSPSPTMLASSADHYSQVVTQAKKRKLYAEILGYKAWYDQPRGMTPPRQNLQGYPAGYVQGKGWWQGQPDQQHAWGAGGYPITQAPFPQNFPMPLIDHPNKKQKNVSARGRKKGHHSAAWRWGTGTTTSRVSETQVCARTSLVN
jgi:hypothetical protein